MLEYGSIHITRRTFKAQHKKNTIPAVMNRGFAEHSP
jgi:hypothetical protein